MNDRWSPRNLAVLFSLNIYRSVTLCRSALTFPLPILRRDEITSSSRVVTRNNARRYRCLLLYLSERRLVLVIPLKEERSRDFFLFLDLDFLPFPNFFSIPVCEQLVRSKISSEEDPRSTRDREIYLNGSGVITAKARSRHRS